MLQSLILSAMAKIWRQILQGICMKKGAITLHGDLSLQVSNQGMY